MLHYSNHSWSVRLDTSPSVYYMLSPIYRGLKRYLHPAFVQDQDMPRTCVIKIFLSGCYGNARKQYTTIVFWQKGALETIVYKLKSIANLGNLIFFCYINEIYWVADIWWNVSLDESGVGEFPQ